MENQEILNQEDQIHSWKLKLRKDMRKIRTILHEYESNQDLLDREPDGTLGNHLKLKAEEYEWFYEMDRQLQECLKKLHFLRLEGGAFIVYPTGRLMSRFDLRKVRKGSNAEPVVFLIDSFGVFRTVDYAYFILNGKEAAIQNASVTKTETVDYAFFILNGKEAAIQNASVTKTEYVDTLERIRIIANSDEDSEYPSGDEQIVQSNDLSDSAGSDYKFLKKSPSQAKIVRLDWKHQASTFYVVPDAYEFTEVIGAHIRHFNQKKVWNIQSLKLLYSMKISDCIQPDLDTQMYKTGISLLRRLWAAIFNIDAPLNDEDLVNNPQWTTIEFQNSKPFTDLRATGLLGLWCLVYYAERSSGTLCPSLYSDNAENTMAYFTKEQDPMRQGFLRDLAVGTVERNYPWAAAGINVLHLLLQKLLHLDGETVCQTNSDPSWNSPLLSFLAYLEPVRESDFSEKDLNENYENLQFIDEVMISGNLRRVSSIHAFTTASNVRNLDTLLNRKQHILLGLEETFCFSMEMLDRMFTSSNAGYLDFPKIMAQLEEKLQEYISPKEKRRSSSSKQKDSKRERAISVNDLWQKLSEDYPLTQ
ncbi:hypothetical protein MP638_000011 [Amoeboaphelidium occidentale]|nr:hypothetical protein MP638_000011 [Amoeboaphelidium occidentale]